MGIEDYKTALKAIKLFPRLSTSYKPTTLKDLADPIILKKEVELLDAPFMSFLDKLKGARFFHKPKSISDYPETIKRILAKHPTLGDLEVTSDPYTPSGYDLLNKKINLNQINPAILAHEAAHAERFLRSSWAKYPEIAFRTANNLAGLAAIPAMIGIGTIKDPRTRRKARNIAAISALALGAPVLGEEIRASANALKFVPNKGAAIKSLLPAGLTYAIAPAINAAMLKYDPKTKYF